MHFESRNEVLLVEFISISLNFSFTGGAVRVRRKLKNEFSTAYASPSKHTSRVNLSFNLPPKPILVTKRNSENQVVILHFWSVLLKLLIYNNRHGLWTRDLLPVHQRQKSFIVHYVIVLATGWKSRWQLKTKIHLRKKIETKLRKKTKPVMIFSLPVIIFTSTHSGFPSFIWVLKKRSVDQ